MKKYLIFVFLLCIGLVSSNVNDLNLVLSSELYGQNQNFEGYFNLNVDDGDLFKLDEEVGIRVMDCSSESTSLENYVLYDLLFNSGLVDGGQYVYIQSGGTSSISINSGENVFAFNTEYPVENLNFSVSGSGGPLFIDIGNDGFNDWQYIGGSTSWSNLIYPLGFEHSMDYFTFFDLGVDNYLAESQDACNDLTITFNEFLSELKIKVEAVARREAEGGDLKAVFSTGESCILDNEIDNWDNITSEDEWVELSCTVELDVSAFSENSLMVGVCFNPTNNNFIVPRYHSSEGDYYFINLRQANYEESLSSEKIEISSPRLVDVINTYRYENECMSEGDCLIPFSLIVDSGNAVIEDLELKHGAILGNTFYNVNVEADEISLTGLNIPLNGFSNFKTPNSKVEDCQLKVKFDGEFDKQIFSTGTAPTALISINSLYIVQNEFVSFSGEDSFSEENKTIIGYLWDFGDGEGSTLAFPTHSYSEKGDYTVSLTVTDAEGITSSVSLVLYVVNLEDHLNSKLPIAVSRLDSALSFFDESEGNIQVLGDLLGSGDLLFSANTSLRDLYGNFTLAKLNLNMSETAKNTIYSQIANDMHAITSITPMSISFKDSSNVIGMVLTSPEDIFNFDNKQNFDLYKDELYNFNKNRVSVDVEYDLFEVKYLEGDANYLLVHKAVNVDGGSNNIFVEDLRNYDLTSFYGNGIKDSSGSVYWELSSSPFSLVYSIEADTLEFIKGIVYSDIDYDLGVNYVYECSTSDCDYSYCGDGYCDIFFYLSIDESDDSNMNYCAVDCGKVLPIGWFIFLFVLLVVGIIYINFYRGPGNFQSLANLVSFKFFKRKVFITDRDKINLSNYIRGALSRGFDEIQIRNALMRRGWNKNQLDKIFKDIRNI